MELSEVIGRIFGRHRKLIALLILAGLLAGFAIHLGDAPQYSASARLVLDTSDPEDQAQSGVIATPPGPSPPAPRWSATRWQKIGARRDATEMARRHVRVQALGSSGVMQLSVTDSDPEVAMALANAIAEAVIKARLQVTAGQAVTVVRQLDQQLDRLQQQISDLDARIDGAAIDGARPPMLAAASSCAGARPWPSA